MRRISLILRTLWGYRAFRIGTALVDVCLFVYVFLINHVAYHEAGIAWNRLTGSLDLQRGGFHVTLPWVAVSNVDLRPQRVCITSNASPRAVSCKLVRFEPIHYREFVATEGHRYYWWANRISVNFGYDEEYRGMKDIFRGYAYASDSYAFLHVDSTF